MIAKIKALFRLPAQFLLISWNKGLRAALLLVLGKFARVRGFPAHWFAAMEKFPPDAPSNAASYMHLLTIKPLISIVMPVYNSRWLTEAIASVMRQSYSNFELILVDDCSSNPETLQALADSARHPAIRLLRNPRNLGISGATNVGIEAARGEYIAFMDHDDLLHPDALAAFARTLNDGQAHDIYFTDEAVINSAGSIIGKMRKCRISLDLLLSCNAVLHFVIMRKSALQQIGQLNPDYDGAQDHDLMLRAMEAGLSFYHLPLMLYAWRAHHSATSNDIRSFDKTADTWPKSYLSGKKAIIAYLQRNRINATVTDDAFFWYRVKYALPEPREEVALIIPFKDQAHYLRRLLQSLPKTTYQNYVIYLVDNRSEKQETKKLLAEFQNMQDQRLRLIRFDEPFNYARLHNKIIDTVPNELQVLMNNDLEIIKGDWLEAMLEHIHRAKVGAVGCRLIYPDGQLQHGGMIFKPDIYYCAANLGREEGYYTKVQREVTGVTAACMLIRKSAFQAVGGFDEIQFPIAFNDADLCLKLVQAGHKIIYTPFAELIHHQSASRQTQYECYEKFALYRRYICASPMIENNYRLT